MVFVVILKSAKNHIIILVRFPADNADFRKYDPR